MGGPLVSVLIPTYNQAEFVRETLDSALGQTYPRTEVIVSDDGSTDGTPDVVEEYVRAHPDRIRLLRSERNTGIAANFNRALQARTGEVYAWLAGDDTMLPERVARQVEVLDARPDAVASVTDAEVFESESGRVLGRFSEMFNGRRGFLEGGAELWLRPGYYVLPSTFMVRSAAVPEGGYDERLRFSNEWIFDIELFRRGPCVPVNEVLVRYRRHRGSVTGSNRHAEQMLEENLAVMAKVETRFPELARLARRRRASLLLSDALARAGRRDWRGARRQVAAGLAAGGPVAALQTATAYARVQLGRRRLGVPAP